MSSAQSEIQQQEIEEYDTDKMPTIADIDEIYKLDLDPMMMLTLDRVANLLGRIAEDDQSVLNKLETWLNTPANEDDDVMDFILDGLGVKIYTKEDWRELQEEKEFVRAMQTDVCCVGCGERVCGFTEEPPHKDRKGEAVCDDCWIDDQDEDDEPQHDICCGCGKYDDTRPVCDCGGSHRSNCAECEDEDCECGNNREKGYDSKGNMRCEDCDIDGPNYNGGLTDDEDEDEDLAYEKRIEALGPKPDDGEKYFICDHLGRGDCKNPVWTRDGGLKHNNQDLWLCPDCFVGDMGTPYKE